MGIRKFVIKFLIFALIAVPVLTFKNLLFYYTDLYKSYVFGSEIYTSLKKTQMKKKVKKLLIGDSVGNQLYDNDVYNGGIFSLTCNQAISMVGQYILLSKFIETNKDDLPEEVILLITPDSFSNNLNQNLTFNYFLKPFYYKENEKYFDELCKAQIKKIPYYYTCKIPFIRSSDWSPEYEPQKDSSYKVISPITSDYLVKIKSLCMANNIKFQLCPTPVRSSRSKLIAEYSKCPEITQGALSNDLNNYFSNIVFMPDQLFKDRNHLKIKNIPVDFLKLRSS
jgi:hypothetical protein